MSNGEEETETIVIGPSTPNGDDWDVTPQTADRVDDAGIVVVPVGEESGGSEQD